MKNQNAQTPTQHPQHKLLPLAARLALYYHQKYSFYLKMEHDSYKARRPSEKKKKIKKSIFSFLS